MSTKKLHLVRAIGQPEALPEPHGQPRPHDFAVQLLTVRSKAKVFKRLVPCPGGYRELK